MNTKHAYLIIAHNQFELLKILLKSIDYNDNDIYLHIDKKIDKVNFDDFYQCIKKSNLYIIDNRINVQWGNYSQIECELNLLEEASRHGYQYYHLMSGVDMPLKSQDYIHNFFNKNYGTQFVHFEKKIIDDEAYQRVSKYHLFCGKNRNILVKILNRIIIGLQFGIDRTRKNKLIYQKGANWFSITDDLVKHIIENKKFIEKNFKYTICADEMFLQTMIINSKFIDKISSNNFNDDYSTIMYYIDWKRGKPYEFTNDDYDELMKSNMLFARKFNWNKDNKIIKRIYEDIKK